MTSSRKHILNVALSLSILFISLNADAAENPIDHGFYTGLQVGGARSNLESGPKLDAIIKEDGGRLSLMAGWAFNEVFSLEWHISAMGFETIDPNIDVVIAGSHLYSVYRFRPGSHFRPHVKGGLGGTQMKFRANGLDPRIEGSSASFGGGFSYLITAYFSMGLEYTFHVIEYNRLTVPIGDGSLSVEIDEQGTAGALGLSFGFYF